MFEQEGGTALLTELQCHIEGSVLHVIHEREIHATLIGEECTYGNAISKSGNMQSGLSTLGHSMRIGSCFHEPATRVQRAFTRRIVQRRESELQLGSVF